MIVTVKDKQSLFDITIEEFGQIDNITEVSNNNNLSISEFLELKQKLIINNENKGNQEIKDKIITQELSFNNDSTLEIIGEKENMLIEKAVILYTNTTQTTIITLPTNAVIWDLALEVVTGFNDTGTDYIDIGVVADQDKYVGPGQDVSSPLFNKYEDLASQNLPDKMTNSTDITFKYTGQNGDATQGLAYIYIHYSLH